ncbi:MAG: hypothetical protein GY696_37705 [Gammaproteobacteria bacterium]|nr:hypothetical protein [Gammaproteobacteria bacterium]
MIVCVLLAPGSDEEQELMNEFLRLLNERNLLTRQELHLSLLEKIHNCERGFSLVQENLGSLINIEGEYNSFLPFLDQKIEVAAFFLNYCIVMPRV